MTSRLEQTLIVLPALNEEASVADVVAEVREKLPGARIAVIDDGSSDRTADIARRAGATVIVLPFNLGVGGAMRAGFKYALAHGFQYVVQVDADGQHDPANVPHLLAALDDADVVLGARFAGEGSYAVRGPRRWAMSVLAFALSRLAHTRLTDTTSGFRATGPRALELFTRTYPAEYLGDTIESLVIALRAGCTVRQVPVAMRARTGGVPSHNPLKSTAYLGRAAMALVIALLRPRESMGAAVVSA
ncbi:glycosyltransferase involved in cell wall biosynthesis [Agromyces sp. 3263]|uniref:glycosyltransferase family 2 protein n=1 Tax=Agromyces sp. 3263 TaxID=2817750 RepID=UPI002857F9DC|nr:glycosyltransferase family 2 protein [Agromyces sp. 3263]MDR6904639.1 glycosyltransferase involved in cell wall biosynthesis [Agromyces sp. 3263]